MAAGNGSKQGRRSDRPEEPQAGRTDWHEQDWPSYSPFAMMRQAVDEMDRWFGRLSDRGWTAPFQSWGPGAFGGRAGWPAVEVFRRGGKLVVRAEVPGMTRQDITVEAEDDTLTISGERRQEREEESDERFWSERRYGSFRRVVPLPRGTRTESAKASFSNGVLEVVMEGPSADARRGRRIDISGQPATE